MWPKKSAGDRLPACRRNPGQLLIAERLRAARVAMGEAGRHAQCEFVDDIERQILEWPLSWIALKQFGEEGEIALLISESQFNGVI